MAAFLWSWGGFCLLVSHPFRRKFSVFSITAPGTCIINKGLDWYISMHCALLLTKLMPQAYKQI